MPPDGLAAVHRVPHPHPRALRRAQGRRVRHRLLRNRFVRAGQADAAQDDRQVQDQHQPEVEQSGGQRGAHPAVRSGVRRRKGEVPRSAGLL